jgi:hypothetical protein
MEARIRRKPQVFREIAVKLNWNLGGHTPYVGICWNPGPTQYCSWTCDMFEPWIWTVNIIQGEGGGPLLISCFIIPLTSSIFFYHKHPQLLEFQANLANWGILGGTTV